MNKVEQLWLKKEFDKLHREHMLILGKLGEHVTPELEQQVRRSLRLAHSIDEKVKD